MITRWWKRERLAVETGEPVSSEVRVRAWQAEDGEMYVHVDTVIDLLRSQMSSSASSFNFIAMYEARLRAALDEARVQQWEEDAKR